MAKKSKIKVFCQSRACYGIDERVSGKLFEQVKSEMVIQKLNERLLGLFIELLQVMATLFEDADEMAVFEKIVNDDEVWERL
jgi:hypothetical protein